MRRFLILALLVATSIVAIAQEDTYYQVVKKMVVVSGATETFKVVVPQLTAVMKVQYTQVPDSFWEELEKDMNETALDDLIKLLEPVYRKHFTEDEMQEIIKFYETPIGKKMAQTAPLIATESMEAGQQWGMQLVQKIQHQLKEKGYIK